MVDLHRHHIAFECGPLFVFLLLHWITAVDYVAFLRVMIDATGCTHSLMKHSVLVVVSDYK